MSESFKNFVDVTGDCLQFVVRSDEITSKAHASAVGNVLVVHIKRLNNKFGLKPLPQTPPVSPDKTFSPAFISLLDFLSGTLDFVINTINSETQAQSLKNQLTFHLGIVNSRYKIASASPNQWNHHTRKEKYVDSL